MTREEAQRALSLGASGGYTPEQLRAANEAFYGAPSAGGGGGFYGQSESVKAAMPTPSGGSPGTLNFGFQPAFGASANPQYANTETADYIARLLGGRVVSSGNPEGPAGFGPPPQALINLGGENYNAGLLASMAQGMTPEAARNRLGEHLSGQLGWRPPANAGPAATPTSGIFRPPAPAPGMSGGTPPVSGGGGGMTPPPAGGGVPPPTGGGTTPRGRGNLGRTSYPYPGFVRYGDSAAAAAMTPRMGDAGMRTMRFGRFGRYGA